MGNSQARALAQHTERQLNVIQRSMRQRLRPSSPAATSPARSGWSCPYSFDPGPQPQTAQRSRQPRPQHRLRNRRPPCKTGLNRAPDARPDRRITLLVASPPVREFLATRMPELALHPLLEALRQATPTELRAIPKDSTPYPTHVAHRGPIKRRSNRRARRVHLALRPAPPSSQNIAISSCGGVFMTHRKLLALTLATLTLPALAVAPGHHRPRLQRHRLQRRPALPFRVPRQVRGPSSRPPGLSPSTASTTSAAASSPSSATGMPKASSGSP